MILNKANSFFLNKEYKNALSCYLDIAKNDSSMNVEFNIRMCNEYIKDDEDNNKKILEIKDMAIDELISEIEGYKKELQEKVDANTVLENNVSILTSKYEKVEEELQEKVDANTVLENNVSILTSKYEKVEEELQEKVDANTVLENNVSILTSKYEKVEEELQEKVDANTVLENNVSILTSKYEKIEEELQEKVDANTVLENNVSILTSKYEKVEEELQEIISVYKFSFNNERKLHKNIQLLSNQLMNTKKHLSYKLGHVLINNSSIRGFLSLPFKLRNVYSEFKKDKLKDNSISLLPYHILKEKDIIPLYSEWFPFIINKHTEDISIIYTKNNIKSINLSIKVFPLLSKSTISITIGDETVLLKNHPLSKEIKINSNEIVNLIKLNTPLVETLRISLKCSNDGIMTIKTNSKNTIKNIEEIELPLPIKGSTLLQSHRLIEKGYIKNGIDFAEKHVDEIFAIELLKANINLKKKDIWLEHVNNYLSQFNIEKLYFQNKDNTINIFQNINSKTKKTISKPTLVSVIMPAFNAEKFIKKSIDSILNQTYVNIELLIINDCSEDDTLRIIEEYEKKDKRVKILNNKINVGPYVSKNLALLKAKGSYITGHDADDWAHPQRIEKHLGFMLNNKNVKASTTKMIRMNYEGKFVSISKKNAFTKDGITRTASISCMFEKVFFDKNLGFWDNIRFGADSEIISRSRKILGNNFIDLDLFSMICLDLENSLTNDPEHGIKNGISPSRKYYKENFLKWHGTAKDLYIDIINSNRPFDAHNDAIVDTKIIQKLINNYKG